MRRLIFIYLGIACIASSCIRNKQVRYKDRMLGAWTIGEEVVQIQADGSTHEVSKSMEVGTISFAEPEFDEGVFLDYTLLLNNSSFSLHQQPFKTDESRSRAFLYYFYCNELFHCDLIATIEKDTRKEQVWSFFRQDNFNGQPTHRKTTWTLTKVE